MKLFSWGPNSYGQLGQGVASNQCVLPFEVNLNKANVDLENIVKIVGGGGHTFLLSNAGKLYGCGWNNVGQLGGKHTEYHNFNVIPCMEEYDIAQVSSKWDSSFAITKTNKCIGWGSNTHGQLGIPLERVVTTESPLELTSEPCLQVEAGLRHCAILTTDGSVLTAGSSRKGQLGRPFSDVTEGFKPVENLPKRVKMIASGQSHSLALTSDNKLFAWGDNKLGQLGLDPTLHQVVLMPIEIPLQEGFIDSQSQIHSGWTHSALLTGNGTIINWGWNRYFQLGSPSYERRVEWKPEPLKGLKNVKNLYIGSEHNLAILEDGVLFSWGWNEHGSCGVGHSQDVVTPVCVNLTKKVRLAGVGSGHSYALVLE